MAGSLDHRLDVRFAAASDELAARLAVLRDLAKNRLDPAVRFVEHVDLRPAVKELVGIHDPEEIHTVSFHTERTENIHQAKKLLPDRQLSRHPGVSAVVKIFHLTEIID